MRSLLCVILLSLVHAAPPPSRGPPSPNRAPPSECGGPQITDSNTPANQCIAFARHALMHLVDDFEVVPLPFSAADDVHQDLVFNPTQGGTSSQQLRPTMNLPISLTQGRCHIGIDWEPGGRPPPSVEVKATLYTFGLAAVAIAEDCIRTQKRTWGKRQVLRANGYLSGLQVTVNINTGTGDPEYQRRLAEADVPKPWYYPTTQEIWEESVRARADSYLWYGAGLSVYP